jgi:hypothetical protein
MKILRQSICDAQATPNPNACFKQSNVVATPPKRSNAESTWRNADSKGLYHPNFGYAMVLASHARAKTFECRPYKPSLKILFKGTVTELDKAPNGIRPLALIPTTDHSGEARLIAAPSPSPASTKVSRPRRRNKCVRRIRPHLYSLCGCGEPTVCEVSRWAYRLIAPRTKTTIALWASTARSSSMVTPYSTVRHGLTFAQGIALRVHQATYVRLV